MNYKLTHITTYEYAEPVSICYNEARLQPLDTAYQRCLDSTITIDPTPADFHERTDFFHNRVAYFSIENPHKTLVVNATSTVSTEPIGKDFENFNKMTWEQVKDWSKDHRDDNTLDAQQYKFNSPLVVKNQELEMYAERSFLKDRLIVDAVQDLMDRIHRDFTYDPHFTTIATPLLKVLKHRRGVCQDFAHLAIGCLRSIGLASRYVSGYIETKPPEGQKRLVGADASHAWFSVYVPEMGWIDFDPTNNQMPTDQHITVAIGRDFHDVTPLKGVIFGGGEHKLKVSVDVENIDTTSTVAAVDNTSTPASTLSKLPDKPEPIS